MMLAPWVLLPVIVALRAEGSVRVLAARSALAVALMGAVNAVATLTGCLAALIWWACHRRTGCGGGSPRGGRVFGAGHRLVGGRAGAAGPDQPAVPRLHRVLGRHHPMAVADRDAARHRQLDAVRRAERDRRCVVGDRVGGGAGDDAGRGGRLAGLAMRTMPPAAG